MFRSRRTNAGTGRARFLIRRSDLIFSDSWKSGWRLRIARAPLIETFRWRSQEHPVGRTGFQRSQKGCAVAPYIPLARGHPCGCSRRKCLFTATIGRHFDIGKMGILGARLFRCYRSAAFMRPTDRLWPGEGLSSQAVKDSRPRGASAGEQEFAEAHIFIPQTVPIL